MKQEAKRFFRSTNLRLDANKPEHFSHYYPTSKSAHVVKAIVEGKPDPASIVVASFGSGKSLAAGTASLIVDNDPNSRKILTEIAERIKGVDNGLGAFALARSKSRTRGLPILLEGHECALPETMLNGCKDRLKYLRVSGKTSQTVVSALDAIAERAIKQKFDRIAIVWDEFGQHLEALASSGKTESLLAVQQIAEWAARQSKPHVSLTLLMHQNLFQYAGNLSQIAKSSWRKIEGRFGSIQYVEDSEELLKLVATVVSVLRPDDIKLPPVKHFKEEAKKTLKAGFFKSYSQSNMLHKLLRDSYPLLPATLHELPKMASRLAQNERTIFTFLRTTDYSKIISLCNLYEYFSDSMRVDSGAGGSYRKWLETESALSKVSETEEKEVLTATTILGLGGSGERKRVRKDALAFAVTNSIGIDDKTAKKTIMRLIGRKLLLHRKNSDDISVWHGTDIDIRSRLREITDSLIGEIDVVDFLQKEHAAPNLRPIRHNIDNSIRRYFQGRFVLASELCKSGEKHDALQLGSREDGAVVFCITENKKEVEDATAVAHKFNKENGLRLVIVVPTTPVPVSNIAGEIAALRKLQGDTDLLAEDPFLLPEIQDMIDAAQENLSAVVHRLVTPDLQNNIWIRKGKNLKISNGYDLHHKLSLIADEAYPLTPVINNELIVRRRVSRQMINARKKLILGVLERTASEHLGFAEDATTPDATLYRTVLKLTGLINKYENGTVWSTPKQLRSNDNGLSHVWQAIEDFFTKPAFDKSFDEIINTLVYPPYGTRTGVIPVLIAAGMKSFGKTIAIKHKGTYLPDILASQIENICSSPADYTLDVLRHNKKLEDYLVGLNELFSKEREAGQDLVRQLYDTIVRWKSRLPASALTAHRINKDTKSVQKAIRGDFDPVELALKILPAIIRVHWSNPRFLPRLKKLIDEIEGTIDGYLSSAIKTINEQLTVAPNSHGNTLQRAHDWASCFTGDKLLMDKISHVTKAILTRSIEAPGGRFTEASFARTISAILLGKNFEQWDDTSVQAFGDKLRETVSILEDTALKSSGPSPALIPLLESRIQHYEKTLRRLKKLKHCTRTRKPRQVANKPR